MRSRELVDSSGRVWRVWGPVPSDRSVLAAEYARGWLTFESGDSVRRYAPLPDDWQSLRDQQLEFLCLCATEMPRRTGPLPRLERPKRPADRAQRSA
jgi:hypothetical protein